MKKVFKQYRHLPTYPKSCIHYSSFLSANPGELTSKESKRKDLLNKIGWHNRVLKHVFPASAHTYQP